MQGFYILYVEGVLYTTTYTTTPGSWLAVHMFLQMMAEDSNAPSPCGPTPRSGRRSAVVVDQDMSHFMAAPPTPGPTDPKDIISDEIRETVRQAIFISFGPTKKGMWRDSKHAHIRLPSH